MNKKQRPQMKPLSILPVFLWNCIIEPYLNNADVSKLAKVDSQFSCNIIKETKWEKLFRSRTKPFALVVSHSASKLTSPNIAKDAHFWSKTCIAMEQHDTLDQALASL